MVVDGKFVGDGIEGFSQQTVVVERPDEVFHDLCLVGREGHFAHLLAQIVVEAHGVSIDHLFGFGLGVVPVSRGIVGQAVVEVDAVECGIELFGTFLAFGLLFE